MNKRIVIGSVLLVAAVALGFAAGQRSTEAAAEGPVVLTGVMSYQAIAEKADQDELYVMRYLEHELDFDWDLTTFLANVAREKMNIMFAAGDLPDVLLGASVIGPILNDAVKAGQLMPLEDRLENGTGWVRTPYWEMVKAPLTYHDGHIYAFGDIVNAIGNRNGGGRYFLNKGWLDEVGMEVPETLEELEDALLAMQEAHPGVPIISGRWDDRRVTNYWMLAFGMKADGWGGALDTQINIIDGEVVFSPMHENFPAYLEYVSYLSDSGLLDPEYFSQQMGQFRAKAKEHNYGFVNDGAPHTLFAATDPRVFEFIHAPAITSEYQPRKVWPEQTIVRRNRYAIPTTSNHPDLAFEILDWMGTTEGLLMMDGLVPESAYIEELVPEGLSKENVVVQPASVGDYLTWPVPLAGMSAWEFTNTYIAPRSSNVPKVRDQQADWYVDIMGRRELDLTVAQDWFEHIMAEAIVPNFEFALTGRDLSFTEDEVEVLDTYAQELIDYIDEQHAKFILGVRDSAEYDAFVEEMKRYGIEQVTEVYQAAYDRWEDLQ